MPTNFVILIVYITTSELFYQQKYILWNEHVREKDLQNWMAFIILKVISFREILLGTGQSNWYLLYLFSNRSKQTSLRKRMIFDKTEKYNITFFDDNHNIHKNQ